MSERPSLSTNRDPDGARQREPVRIAYIMSRFPKITETFILYEILELAKLGIAVEVYPLMREHTTVEHPEVKEVTKLARFHPFLSLRILKANWHYLRRRPRTYLKLIARVLAGTFRSRRFFVRALAILPKSVCFAHEMEQRGITRVHAHFASHPALSALIINQLTSIPFSFTAHGSDIHVDQHSFDMKIQAADFAVMVSDYNKEFLVEKFGTKIAGKMPVIRCGVDPDSFTPRRRTRQPVFRILCVAALREVKGHRFLIEACRLLKDRDVEFTCDLVGDGPLRRRLETQIAASGLKDTVILHGSLPRPQIVEMMQSADVAVLPSVLDRDGRREGIPVSLMEAMACGLPVISSQLSGIPELVEADKSGILTPPGDSGALAAALERLSRSEELRHLLGQAGREKVVREFDLRKNTAKLAAFFLGSQNGTAH